jgi:hypothetical protein
MTKLQKSLGSFLGLPVLVATGDGWHCLMTKEDAEIFWKLNLQDFYWDCECADYDLMVARVEQAT